MNLLLPLALTILNSTDVSYTEVLCGPAVVHQCDLIVEASVTGTGVLESATMRLPKLDQSGFPKDPAKSRPERVVLWNYEARVHAVYLDHDSSVATNTVIRFSTLHKAVPVMDPKASRVHGYKNHRLNAGIPYLLLLRKMLNDPGHYYLPYNRHCAVERDLISAHYGENFKDVLNPEKWGWSEPDEHGLEIATLVRSPVSQTVTNTIDFQIALRHGADEPVTLLLHPALRPIQLDIRQADGEPTEIQPDLYARKAPVDPRAVFPLLLRPGQIVFIRESGPTLQWVTAPPALEAGSYSFRTRYRIPVTNTIPEFYWRGTVEAPPARFEILSDDGVADREKP